MNKTLQLTFIFLLFATYTSFGFVTGHPSDTTTDEALYTLKDGTYKAYLDKINMKAPREYEGKEKNTIQLKYTVKVNRNEIESVNYLGRELYSHRIIHDEDTEFRNYWSYPLEPVMNEKNEVIAFTGLLYFSKENGRTFKTQVTIPIDIL